MRTLYQTVNSGTPWIVSMRASYFRLLEAGAPVNINFYRQGAEVGNADVVGAGFWSESAAGDFFDTVILSSDVTQFLKVILTDGRGGYDVQAATSSGTTSTALGTDYLAALLATVALMYPSMISDEIDVFELFVAGGYTSTQQAIYAAESFVQASAANLRGVLSETIFS